MTTHAAAHMMKQPQDPSATPPAYSGASDSAIARAIVAAIRAMPGIADVSPGLVMLAATYGPCERVVGVVVRHDSPHDTAVEIHVVVEGVARPNSATRGGDAPATPGEASDVAVLAQVVSQIRATICDVVSSLNLVPLSAIDVFIDDIQFPEGA